jgi:hypothetical protein
MGRVSQADAQPSLALGRAILQGRISGPVLLIAMFSSHSEARRNQAHLQDSALQIGHMSLCNSLHFAAGMSGKSMDKGAMAGMAGMSGKGSHNVMAMNELMASMKKMDKAMMSAKGSTTDIAFAAR